MKRQKGGAAGRAPLGRLFPGFTDGTEMYLGSDEWMGMNPKSRTGLLGEALAIDYYYIDKICHGCQSTAKVSFNSGTRVLLMTDVLKSTQG